MVDETQLTNPASMVEITALAKRRGFIFQSSQIYGGIGGFFDYGPLGAILNQCQGCMVARDVEMRDDVVGFDSSIIMHPHTWSASGHIDAFHDPHGRLQSLQARFRLDHLKSLEQCPDCGKNRTSPSRATSI